MPHESIQAHQESYSAYAPAARRIAVVSGKGGSGKTLVSTMVASVLDKLAFPTLLVDADSGTGGLTYYLSLKNIPRVGFGISDMAVTANRPTPAPLPDMTPSMSPAETFASQLHQAIQPIRPFNQGQFLGIGNHRRLYNELRNAPFPIMPFILKDLLNELSEKHPGWIIVDCRGGIDEESLAVCEVVDDILLVVEMDTTSFQASTHLVDVLADNGLDRKLRGFVINKVIDDPTLVARGGLSQFRCQYLSSIPFDLDTTRAFLAGDVPEWSSLFGIHVWQALAIAFPEEIRVDPPGHVWSNEEYREIGFADIQSIRGGVLTTVLEVSLAVILVVLVSVGVDVDIRFIALAAMAIVTGIIGSSERARRLVGSIFSAYGRPSRAP